jgi:FKBP-type peptidyl-prolyl cis-trans isomerase FklB
MGAQHVAPRKTLVATTMQFAEIGGQCENNGMRKTLIKTSIILAASMISVGYGAAQTPAGSTPATGAQTATPKAQSGTGSTGTGSTGTGTAKTGTGTKSGTGTAKTGTTPFTLKTEKDKQSYAIGLNIGKSMHQDGVEVEPNVLARGIKDALAGGKVLMTDDEIKATLTALSASMKKAQEEKMAALGAVNKSQGDAFLAANKGKEGVVTLPSGLQYKVLKEGSGPKPTAADTVVCNYRGTLINGKEFDSSYKRGQPATFPVGQVIKGWTEALQLMPVGSKWELYVPADLAYQNQQRGPDITPESTLVFEVELLSIQPKADLKTAPGTPTPPGETKQ